MENNSNKYSKELQYLKNTGSNEVPISWFDEDHEPIGPKLREQMKDAKLISERNGKIIICDS